MGEIIHIHIGQCGVQLGSALWEQHIAEHGVEHDGSLSTTKPFEKSENQINKLFYETKEGKYHARSLFVDADSFVIDGIKKGENRQIFNPNNLFCHKEESRGTHPQVYYCYDKKFHQSLLDRLRQLFESCESPQGVIMTHSICGGFGSGYGSLLLHKMMVDYAKKSKITYSMFPSPKISNLVVEPYNMILGMMSLIEYADLSILFDNEALYNICSNQMEKESPNYADINRMVARALSTSFSSTRFHSSFNANLGEMITSLVPYPRIHYAMPSYAPFGDRNRTKEIPLSIEDLTDLAFNQGSVMLSSNLKLDKYISCCVAYRGRVDPETAVNAVNKVKKLREVKTVSWCPTGFKTGITYQDPVIVNKEMDTKRTNEVGVLINSTNFAKIFEREAQKFDSLYRPRAFVHWFVGVGMESGEFAESRENFHCLRREYEEISQYSAEDLDDDD